MSTPEPLYPTALELAAGNELRIAWSDGRCDSIPIRRIRQACPCAHCRQAQLQPSSPPPMLPVLTAQQARPLTIEAMHPVGQYAYGIAFSDGHHGGIFTFELLRSLGQEP